MKHPILPDTENLTTDQRAVFLGIFLNPKTTLTMHNEKTRLTARTEAALDDLIERGWVSTEHRGKAVTYRMTELGQSINRRKLAKGYGLFGKDGEFPIAEPIPEATK